MCTDGPHKHTNLILKLKEKKREKINQQPGVSPLAIQLPEPLSLWGRNPKKNIFGPPRCPFLQGRGGQFAPFTPVFPPPSIHVSPFSVCPPHFYPHFFTHPPIPIFFLMTQFLHLLFQLKTCELRFISTRFLYLTFHITLFSPSPFLVFSTTAPVTFLQPFDTELIHFWERRGDLAQLDPSSLKSCAAVASSLWSLQVPSNWKDSISFLTRTSLFQRSS